MRSSIIPGIAATVGGGAIVACSLLTDLGGLGGSDGGAPTSCIGNGVQCIGPPPPGWSGPFILYDGNPASQPASCPAVAPSLALDGHANLLSAGAADCTPCSCSVSNITCLGDLRVSVYSDTACGSTHLCATATVDGGDCFHSAALHCGTSNSATSLKADAPVATGTCSASSVPGDGGASWQRAVMGCEPAQPWGQLDCPAGQVCAPTPPTPFNGKACIMQQGDAGVGACPGAPYSELHPDVMTKLDVSCDCSCDNTSPPSGVCSVGGIDYVGTSTACTPTTTVTPFGACIPTTLSASAGTIHTVVTPPSTINCNTTSSGNTITPGGPVTVCCVP